MTTGSNINYYDFQDLYSIIKRVYRQICNIEQSIEFGIVTAVPTDPPATDEPTVVLNTLTGILYYWDGNSWEVYGGQFLLKANNLSDVASASSARNNILPSKVGNALKVLRVNAGATDYELATIAGGGSPYEELTYAAAAALVLAETVEPGKLYKITDRGDAGIFVWGDTTTSFYSHGIRKMLIPEHYDAETVGFAVWHEGYSPVPGEYITYCGNVYLSISGVLGTRSSTDSVVSTLDNTNWTVLAKDESEVALGRLRVKFFEIEYDFTNDWIYKQWDEFGNTVGVDYNDPIASNGNPVDYTDWGLVNRITGTTSVRNNICPAGFAACTVSNNLSSGDIIIEDNITTSKDKGICHNTSDTHLYIVGNQASAIHENGIYYSATTELRGNKMTDTEGVGALARNYGASETLINHNIAAWLTDNTFTGGGLYITLNSAGAQISGNLETGIINANTCSGEITSNTAVDISYNICHAGGINSNNMSGYAILGNIAEYINENTGIDIQYNKARRISLNACGGQIQFNNIPGDITNNIQSAGIEYNTNNGHIDLNAMNSAITQNSNNGNISGNAGEVLMQNKNNGGIANNLVSSIYGNGNNGEISGNACASITYNFNNGYIISCNDSGNGFNVMANVNNGNINNPAGLSTGDITDTIINK